jgi:preprotein translocase subunit YajC
MPIDPLTIGMVLILAVLVFFMFRNSRKRKAQQAELQTLMQPGAYVMTNFGVFGTLKSVNEFSKQAELEIAPGVTITVHQQTLAKVVDPDEPRSVEEAQARAEADQAALESESEVIDEVTLDEPEFGERIDPKKPGRAPKKTDE